MLSHNLESFTQIASKASSARDPDRPKLPASAYLRFAADYRAKNTLKGGKESMQTVAAAWKNASLVDKAPFVRLAAQEKDVYQKAFDQYKDSGKLEAWKRDPAAPKRATPPYFSWALERRQEARFRDVKPADAAKLLKPEWDALPQSQKDALKTKYASDMEAYRKQKADYDASAGKQVWLEKTGKLNDLKLAEAEKAKETEKKEAQKLKVLKAKEAAKAKQAAEKEKAKLAKEKLKQKAADQKAKLADKNAKEKLAKAAKAAKAVKKA